MVRNGIANFMRFMSSFRDSGKEIFLSQAFSVRIPSIVDSRLASNGQPQYENSTGRNDKINIVN